MRTTHTLQPTDLENLRDAAECLRTLAHPVRLRMVQLMLRDHLTVGRLAESCGIPSHVASEHLRMMQHCGLLTRRQEGRRMYYQVAEPTLARIMECIESRFGTPGPQEGTGTVAGKRILSGGGHPSDGASPLLLPETPQTERE
jgi:ArsR family transcriptional regulator, zinc-responsive transcriptional repressor